MATEAAPVNGLYGTNQYSQPAELAASTPSAPTHGASASQSTSTSATAQKADPQEIGWYFVEQYYTTLSKSPEKIHLFYSKKSQLVTGIEADKVVPAVGTKAISEKIKALDFQDCKVRVLNVDSQSSFTNIVVQVIGEMSNKSEPHHKFVQTFVLAEQPNGYFVLNDIFRYLKDDEDEIVDDEPVQPEVPAEEPPTPADGQVNAEDHVDEVVASETSIEKVDEKLEEEKAVVDETESTEVNGALVPDATEESAAVPESTSVTEETEEKSVEAPAEEQAAEPETSAATSAPTETASPAAPEAPPAKKTWASMLGGGGVKAPAVPALPVATPASQSKSSRPAPAAQASKPTSETAAPAPNTTSSTPTSQSNGWQTAEGKKGKTGQNKPTEGVVLAYIKNVNEKVDARILREVLESFGELKYFDVSRQRNCAFVEFADPSGYAAAVAGNPHTVGTETISVEERRPRPTAYGGAGGNFAAGNNYPSNTPNNTRGNGNAGRGGGARGGFQGPRSGSQTNFPKDAGRGGFQPRGGKSGRGQTQTA